MTKICSKCKIEKPDEAFCKLKRSKNGLKPQCKECDVKYRQTNKSKIKIYNAEYKKNHRGDIKIYNVEYRQTNKSKIKIYNAEYKKNHWDDIKIKTNEWRQINKDNIAKYKEINKNKIKIRAAKHNKDIRLKVLMYYSNNLLICKECGERHIEFLEIDHINGGGTKHRKNEGIGSIYTYLKMNNFPEGYQVLCSNCNWKKIKVDAKIKGKFGTNAQIAQYNRNFKLRLDIFSHYKTDDEIKCACPNCNVDDTDLLCLDHINGDGTEHRKKINNGDMYKWVKNNNYPDTFRLLCHKCNQSLNKYDYCPHDIK